MTFLKLFTVGWVSRGHLHSFPIHHTGESWLIFTKSFLWLSCLKSVRNNVLIHFIAKEVRVKATKTLNVISWHNKRGFPYTREDHEGEWATSIRMLCFLINLCKKYEQDRSLDITPREKNEKKLRWLLSIQENFTFIPITERRRIIWQYDNLGQIEVYY